MMTPQQLFARRLKENAKFQWSILNMTVDWTVALYIVVPALFFLSIQYYDWMVTPPEWFSYIPFALVSFVLFLYASSGTLRCFLEAADQLVLLQHPHWVRELRRRGLLYTLTKQLIETAAILSFLTPFLTFAYSFTAATIVWLGIFTYLYKLNSQLIWPLLETRYSGWRLVLLQIPLFCISFFLYFSGSYWIMPIQPLALLLCILLSFAALVLWKKKLQGARALMVQDIRRDYEAKMKFTGFVLANVTSIQPKSGRKRPLLFRSSNRLFNKRTAANGIAETGIKLFFRSKPSVLLYIQFVSVCSFGMIALPFPMKWVLWAAAAFLLSYMVKQNGQESRKGPFIKMFSWKDGVIREATKRMIVFTAMPGYLIISAVLGAAVYSWLGAMLLLPVGGVLGYWAAGLLTMFDR
ncbi:ABC transporter permease [Paenibacillus sp. J2TS4]|uniref:ABC transporter permease n=1 Tax=Paenibacillus sp. J2TS4 TaxID=2807194 RepID=UPI001B1CD07B|nr:ABC transporter permease [Paenibacillus sp. J2TS4]GIP34774.1 ABC transporter permease [Paenibacillus sp. J2TS4]